MNADAIWLDRAENVMNTMLESWNDVPLYSVIFESSDPAVQNAEAKANKVGNDAGGLLQKMIAKLKGLFRKIKEIISNAIQFIFASNEDRIGFEEFTQQVNSDPQLAQMKVRFIDYKNFMAQMEADVKKYETEYTKFKQSQAENNPNLLSAMDASTKDFRDMAANLLKSKGSKVALSALVEYAKGCRHNAARIQQFIELDIGLLDAIERDLGRHEVKKFKNKIKHLNSEYEIIRKIHGMREQQSFTVKEALNACLNGTIEGTLADPDGKKGIGATIKTGMKISQLMGVLKKASPEGYRRMKKGVIKNVPYILKQGRELNQEVREKEKKAAKLRRKTDRINAKTAKNVKNVQDRMRV